MQVNIPEWNLCTNVIQSEEAHPKCHSYYTNYLTGQKNHMHESQIESNSSNLVIKYLNSRNLPTSCTYMRFDQKEEKKNCQWIIIVENKHEMKSKSPNQLIYVIKLFEILKTLLAVL